MIVNTLFGLIVIFIVILLIFIGFSKQRAIIVYLLIISLLLGPRIPLGQLTDMQRLDLRIGDLIILFMFVIAVSLLLLKRIKFNYPPYIYFLILFVLVSLLSSIIAVVHYKFPLNNAFLFWGKEMLYISLCFSIPLFIRKKENMVTMIKVICFAMAINIAWLFFQIVTGSPQQLIKLVEVPSYGYASVGESQVSEVASIYAYTFILFMILFSVYRKSLIISAMILGSLIGLLGTLSRSLIASTAISAFILFVYLLYAGGRFTIKSIFIISIVLIITIAAGFKTYSILESQELPTKRFKKASVEEGFFSGRKELIWEPLWDSFLKNPIIGYGKGSVREIIHTFDEAHNYYLRLLVETGIIGTTLFLLFLIYLIKTSFNLLNKVNTKSSYIIVLNMIMITMVLCITSFVQDGFYASKLTIPFYINVGLINLIYMKEPSIKNRTILESQAQRKYT